MDQLNKLRHSTITENGDEAFDSTGDNLLDILFMASYYEKHLSEVHISNSPKEKLFSMFMRDPRHGLGRRDLGRKLMELSEVEPCDVVLAGRFDDLLYTGNPNVPGFWFSEIKKGNVLAKKWAPRLTGKDGKFAKFLCNQWGLKEKKYRSLIKCPETVEFKLSYAEPLKRNVLEAMFKTGGVCHPRHPLVDVIDFSKVPSLAMIKYYNRFLTGEDTRERFSQYLKDVRNGKKDLKIATTTVYDIYRNSMKIDADLFFDKIEKIPISCVPIIDSSGSMYTDDAIGKALSIGHYLALCSSYCNGYAISFSSHPRLLKVQGDSYNEQIKSLYTGDCSNTDLGKVMKLLTKLDKDNLPDYFVVLSDMEFDQGSVNGKDFLMASWREQGIKTKIVWWNFCNREKISPETDDYGNIFLSGYSPMLLKYLETGFNARDFLDKLLVEYSKKINK